jgi:hypothetical protein
VVGAFGAAKGVSGIFILIALMIFVAVYVPLAIAALMVVGLLMGINYGRLGPAIVKMSAIAFIANGIGLIGVWMGLPGFVTFPICCFISFGLFMTQFDLDVAEANASTGALNVMNFVANVILIAFLVVAESSTNGVKDVDEDDPPAEQRERTGDWDGNPVNPEQPPFLDDDD